MGIVLTRIDDRLIHGQVVTGWVSKYAIEQIIVVDDVVAGDPMQRSVLMMTAPPDIKVVIFSVAKFLEVISRTEIKRRTMLIFRDPTGVLRMLNAGVTFDSLNIGGMRKIGDRTISISKAVYFSEEEKVAVLAIMDKGVEINIQMVPQDKSERLERNTLERGGDIC